MKQVNYFPGVVKKNKIKYENFSLTQGRIQPSLTRDLEQLPSYPLVYQRKCTYHLKNCIPL